MRLKKEGFPEDDELVLCSVTKIHFHSVFVNLDEYHKSGMVHISEISAGRIRNIRDYVVEGKVVVCKVLRIDSAKGHIDLSLRRVNEGQKRQKLEEIKKQQKAEKIIEQVAKQMKADADKLFTEVNDKVLEEYDSLHDGFEAVVKAEVKLEDLGIDKKYVEDLDEVIKTRITPEEVIIKGKLKLQSYLPNGVEIIKEALKKAREKANDTTKIFYLGAGTFKTIIRAEEYKEAEEVLKNMIDSAQGVMKHQDNLCEFARED
jgi:translation initiation factor 2 subunit 1